MSPKKSSAKNEPSFLKRSQKKFHELKNKLRTLTKKESDLTEKSLELPKKPETHEKEIKIAISVKSVVKSTIAVLLLIGLVMVLGVIKSVIIVFLVSLFFAAVLNPGVDRLERYKIPRSLGIILIYLLVIGVFVFMFSSLIPIIAKQIEEFGKVVGIMIHNLVSQQNSDSSLVQWA